jgi:hypothetical protein
MKKNTFQYSLEDYIFQNMLRDIKIKADTAKEKGDKVDEVLWTAIAQGFKDDLQMEVTAVMKALYSAFNRKNYDELRTLWLPDENVEMTVPGFDKVVSRTVSLYDRIVVCKTSVVCLVNLPSG